MWQQPFPWPLTSTHYFFCNSKFIVLMKNMAAEEIVLEIKPNNNNKVLLRKIQPPQSSIKFTLTNSKTKCCNHFGSIQKQNFQSSDESKMLNLEEIIKFNYFIGFPGALTIKINVFHLPVFLCPFDSSFIQSDQMRRGINFAFWLLYMITRSKHSLYKHCRPQGIFKSLKS